MSDVSPEQEKGMISRFWAWLFRSQTLQVSLLFLLVFLVIVFVGVLSFESVEKHTAELLDLPSKNEILKFLGIGMGGVLVALQALMSYKRAKAMEQTAEAQADAAKAQADAVSKTEQGQRQDRLKNAIEHLGHKSDSVRLGGAYELFHLAEDTEDLRQTVLDILCAHIRQTTGESEYQETHTWEPSEEIQSLLTLLFVQKHEVFKGCHINLQGSWLNGAELFEARMQKVDLFWAQMQGVRLFGAQMQGACLLGARMQGADLSETRMQGADLSEAQMQGVRLFWAQMQGADLSKAQMQGACLFWAQMQGADLSKAQMQGVQSQEQDYLSFSQRMEKSIGKESDLSGVILAGELTQEDVGLLVKNLDDEEAKELRQKLAPHIGKPKSNQLPKNSGAITGSYTEKKAKKWIAEYEKATSEVPKDDS